MTKHNPNNERIKRQYFIYLRNARQQSVQAVDGAASALARFENQTKHRDFKLFRSELAIAFKKHLAEQVSQKSGRN